MQSQALGESEAKSQAQRKLAQRKRRLGHGVDVKHMLGQKQGSERGDEPGDDEGGDSRLIDDEDGQAAHDAAARVWRHVAVLCWGMRERMHGHAVEAVAPAPHFTT